MYHQDHSNITQWFASKPIRKLISIIPSTNSKCISLPPDVYPIIPIDQTTFKIEPSTAIVISSPNFCTDFEDYIQSLPQWISTLISNFRTSPLADSLVQYIQQQTRLYISTDGSTTNRKSGGSWIVSLNDGTEIVSDWNPDFGQIGIINLYHSEIYASLASQSFLECYCNYFHLQLLNPIESYCDNKSYVTKYNELQSNAYSKLCIHKRKEHEAYLALLPMISKNFHLYHVKGHQDELKTWEDLTTPERLNIQADLIATKKAKPPLNIPLPSAPFAIYIHQK